MNCVINELVRQKCVTVTPEDTEVLGAETSVSTEHWRSVSRFGALLAGLPQESNNFLRSATVQCALSQYLHCTEQESAQSTSAWSSDDSLRDFSELQLRAWRDDDLVVSSVNEQFDLRNRLAALRNQVLAKLLSDELGRWRSKR